jgi:hypothetical protein
MDSAVHLLASLVPQPELVPFKDSFVYRHVENLPQQATVQKLSRITTGLKAANVLCNAGLFQEQAALQRMVDEIGEDVHFLCIPAIKGATTNLHSRYLEIFFQEEYDSTTGKPLEHTKPMVQRKNIRAYIANNGGGDPSGHIKASKTVHKADSGYVHAASPHIMDSYGGNPPHFHTNGMLGTPRETEYRWYLKNYFFRACTSFAIAANAFVQADLHKQMTCLMKDWERELEAHRW